MNQHYPYDTAIMVTVKGQAVREDDPMHDPFDRAIYKRIPASELPETVARWLALGRTITSITY